MIVDRPNLAGAQVGANRGAFEEDLSIANRQRRLAAGSNTPPSTCRAQVMNQLKNDQMFPGHVLREDPALGQSRPDLGLLARKLTEIADQLLTGENGRQDRTPSEAARAAVERRQTSLEGTEFLRRHAHRPAPELKDVEQSRVVYGSFAREAYATRRKRGAIFGNPELFGEPAWDILLDLYIAHVENKAVSVSSACIGSAAPPTTGLRWLGVLTEHGLILREHDPEDQRRVLVRLTDRGLSAMDEYFASLDP